MPADHCESPTPRWRQCWGTVVRVYRLRLQGLKHTNITYVFIASFCGHRCHPSFLPAFLPACLLSFAIVLPSFLPLTILFFYRLPSVCPSVRPSFLPSVHPSFLPSHQEGGAHSQLLLKEQSWLRGATVKTTPTVQTCCRRRTFSNSAGNSDANSGPEPTRCASWRWKNCARYPSVHTGRKMVSSTTPRCWPKRRLPCTASPARGTFFTFWTRVTSRFLPSLAASFGTGLSRGCASPAQRRAVSSPEDERPRRCVCLHTRGAGRQPGAGQLRPNQSLGAGKNKTGTSMSSGEAMQGSPWLGTLE